MAKPYSEDLRGRVVGAGQDGATIPETAEQLGVSISSVVRFRRLHRETGSVSPAYVEQFLAPTLKRDDVVFMDNVSVHKVDGVEEAIEARGAIPFYLPAYSPDLNPIEQLFAKLKALLRKVAAYTLKNAAFTVRSLCKAVASCLNQISRTECAAY